MARDEDTARLCPRVERAFGLLGRKWMGLVVRSLSSGERFYCELERDLPSLSARVLLLRLRELEEAGLAERVVHAGPPARVSYRLSKAGAGLQSVIASIEAWAEEAAGAENEGPLAVKAEARRNAPALAGVPKRTGQ